jgi:hypothetical protein
MKSAVAMFLFGGMIFLLAARQSVDAQAVAAVKAATEAAKVVDKIGNDVSGMLTSGSSNVAWVKWVGNLKYRIKEIHGKVIQQGADSHGGTIAIMKRDSALVGGEHKVTFLSPRTGQAIAEVYLTTFYKGAQPQVRMTYGDEYFKQKTIERHGSTALVLALIQPV